MHKIQYTSFTVLVMVLSVLGSERAFSQAPATKNTTSNNLLVNGDFEQGQTGWFSDWGWADVDANMQVVGADDDCKGNGALEMTCTRYGSGRTQCHSNLFTIQEGKAYKISFDARANGVSWIFATLRMRPGPWTVHIQEKFTLLPQWQHFEMVGLANKTQHMDQTAVFFEFLGVGTIGFDNVTVTEIDLPETKPRDTGNLVPNGSFEVDPTIDNWIFSNRGSWLVWEIDPTTASQGARSYKGKGALSSAFIQLRPFVPHTLAVDVKSDKPTRTTIKLMGSVNNLIFQKDVKVGTDWKRFTVSGNSKIAIDNNYYLLIENNGDTCLWVDGVYLAEGNGDGAYQPSAAVEASAVVVPDVSKVFTAGKPIQVILRFAIADWNTDNSNSENLSYIWSLKDTYGNTEATGTGQVTADRPEVTISLSPKKFGMYRIEVQPDGGKTSEDVFAVVYPHEKTPDPNSPFGTHFIFQSIPMDIVKKLGIAKERCHWPPVATQWICVEPKKGEFHFKDSYVATAKENGISLLGSLAGTPGWAFGETYRGFYITRYPTNLDDWRNYVRSIVKRHPEIREWEFFNEPELDIFFQGTPEEFISLFISGAEEIKKIDPSLKIVGFGNANKKKMISHCLPLLKKHDALKYLSAISVHLYSPGSYIDRMEELLKDMRTFLNEAGYPGIEIWDSESGGSTLSFRRVWWKPKDKGETQEQQTLYYTGEFIKNNVAKLSLGVSRIYVYMIEGSTNVDGAFSYALLDVDRGPRPMIPALAMLVRFLETAKPLGKVNVNDTNLRAFRFQRDNDEVLFAWSEKDASTKPLDLNGINGIKAYDVMGNEIHIAEGKTTITAQPQIYVIPKNLSDEFMKRL